MISNKGLSFLTGCALFFLPFALWVYSFRGFYSSGEFILFNDAQRTFTLINHFLSHITRGVFPVWNPFNAWGRPDDFNMRIIGEFNPFLYLIGCLTHLGLSFSLAYFIFVVAYYFFGLMGFYLLAKRIFRDEWPSQEAPAMTPNKGIGGGAFAYLALILLMFSTQGALLFNDVMIIFIFVPTAWFFYFLVTFTETHHKRDFLGLTFVVMMIATTNLPFYFLTLFLAFLICFCILFFRDLKSILPGYFKFLMGHKILVVFCLLSFGMSLVPELLWYKAATNGEYVFNWRGVSPMSSNVADLTLEAINRSGIVGVISLAGLFSGLNYSVHVGFPYIPIFAFLILLLGSAVPVSKRLVLFLSASLLVFLISLGSLTPIHRFLYHHVFFFRLFRNLQFLVWLSVPGLVLFLTEQCRLLLSYSPRTVREKWVVFLYVVMIHAGFAFFLCQMGNVIASSFWVVGLSFLFFLLYFGGCLHPNVFKGERGHSTVMLFFFLILVAVQPLEVFHYLVRNSKGQTFPYSKNPYSLKESYPRFSFIRPTKGEPPIGMMRNKIQEFGDVTDTSGFVEGNYAGLKWSYFLSEHCDPGILKEYVRYKFFVYDNVEWLDDEKVSLKDVERAWAQNRNVAFVARESVTRKAEQNFSQTFGGDSLGIGSSISDHKNKGEDGLTAQAITGNSVQFAVLSFDLNFIKFKTNFNARKFLVYNDSFHRDWRARINGKQAEILRANVAFKGLWLPAGENIVYLRYRWWQDYFGIFLAVFFGVFFLGLVYAFMQVQADA